LKQTIEQTDIVTEIMYSARVRYLERKANESRPTGRVDPDLRRLFFITGDGGTGKTFTYNVFCYY
jgi:hypothetical protein